MKSRSEYPERRERAPVGSSRVQSDGRFAERRQRQGPTDVHHAGLSKTTRQRGNGKTRDSRCDDGTHATASKSLGPRNLGFVERADRVRAHAARCRQDRKSNLFPPPVTESGCGKPSEFVFQNGLSPAPVSLATNDDGIKICIIESIEQFTREADPNVQIEAGIKGVHARQYGCEFRACDMVADAKYEPALGDYGRGNGTVMCSKEIARAIKERSTFGR